MRKKNIKPVILETLHNFNGPATIGGIEQATCLSRSSVKDCLERLILERCVVKKKFSDEGISPFDYRVSDKGRTPRYYFVLRYPLGMKKLQYFADIGLIELK